MTPDDPIWDDPFHAAAWQAFAEGVARTQGIPDSGATKRRAYAMYETELAARHRGQGVITIDPTVLRPSRSR